MSICVTESAQSRRMLDAMFKEQDAQEQAEQAMADEFAEAIKRGTPEETATWAPMVKDYAEARKRRIRYDSPLVPIRHQTGAECLADALDFSDGPGMGDVLELLSLALKSTDRLVADAANVLVDRAAKKFAKHYTPEVEA